MYLVMQRLCIRYGISYQEPLLPVHLSAPQPAAPNAQSPAALAPGHRKHPAAVILATEFPVLPHEFLILLLEVVPEAFGSDCMILPILVC